MSAGVRTWFPFGIAVGLSASVAPLPELRLVLAGLALAVLIVALVWSKEGAR